MVINIKEASRKKRKKKHPTEPSQKFLTHRTENYSCFKSLSPGCFVTRQRLTNTKACLRTHITLGKPYCLFQCLHEAWDWLEKFCPTTSLVLWPFGMTITILTHVCGQTSHHSSLVGPLGTSHTVSWYLEAGKTHFHLERGKKSNFMRIIWKLKLVCWWVGYTTTWVTPFKDNMSSVGESRTELMKL